jgi:glutamate/tyrosine decarboxylase-like PLP-dependent enzyme
VAERVAHHVRLAGEFRDWVEAEKEWKLMAPASMGLVLCRHEPAGMDEVEIAAHNARIMEAVNANGRSFLSHTLVGGERYALRVAVGNLRTQRRHLENLWSELKELTST